VNEQQKAQMAIVKTLTGAWQALSDLGATLDEAQWKSPSDLPGWSVQDLLAHVIGIERLLDGLPAADPLPGDPPPHVRNPIGELNEREVGARRFKPGAEVLAEWEELSARRQRTLAAADEAYFAQPIQTPTGPGTMTDFLAMRILDCWVHEQDMRRALELPATYGSTAAEHTVDRLAAALPMVVGKRAACPEGAAVAVELRGPVQRRHVCRVTDGRAAFVEQSTVVAATIAMDTESFVLLATGRRTPDQLADRIEVSGDADLAAKVLAGLNVMM
jgi:uncharacterized protein (TIGR03083 family)